MHRTLISRMACLAVLTLAFGVVQAADIIWSAGPSFGGPNGHQGILTNGALVEAVHLRGWPGLPEVVDPTGLNIAFTPIDSTAFAKVYTDPPNGIGDPIWSTIVRSFEWNAWFNVTAIDFLSGLTPGHTYQVQFFAGRSDPCCESRTQRFGDGNGHFSEPISFKQMNFVSVVGTFVAHAPTQAIVFDDSSNNPQLSAYVLRDLTAAVPEPATWAMMLGGLLSVAGFLRWRKR